ncbi:MAG: DUF4192 family protein [Catenulispora sp.]
MDHDLTTAPDTGAPTAGGPDPGSSGPGSRASGRRVPPRPRSASGEDGGMDDGTAVSSGNGDAGPEAADAAGGAAGTGTVRLASPGSVVASIPLLFGFHPDNSLVVLGISRPAAGGRFIRHGVRIDLDQIRGQERTAALELAARLRDHDAEVAILVAFGPRDATGAQARPDHCRKLMAAFRAQIEAAPTEERVTVVDALYTCNGRWWSYMCRNTRCCPTTGTVVPAEAPPGLTSALTARGHTVYPSREALDATLAPYPPEVLARTAAAAEPLDPTWYDTDAGLADARRLMDALLLRCGDPDEVAPAADGSRDTDHEAVGPGTQSARSTSAARIAHRGLNATATVEGAARVRASNPDSAGDGGTDGAPSRRRTAAAESPRNRSVAAHARAANAVSAVGTSESDSTAPSRRRTAAPSVRAARVDSAIRADDADSESPRRRTAGVSERAAGADSARGDSAPAESAASGRLPAIATNAVRGRASTADSARGDSAPAESAAPGRLPATATNAVRRRAASADLAATSALRDFPAPRRTAAAESPRPARRGLAATATVGTVATDARRRALKAESAIPAARSVRRVTDRVAASDEWSAPDGDAPLISDAEVAELLIALLNWRVRDYLACAAATEDSAARLLRLCTELARRAPHPELRLAPYALAAWAAWAMGRPSVAQCAVDRALAIDPEYKFASLIRAGLHHAIDGGGVRESAANTRRDLFGQAVIYSDTPDPDAAPVPVPSQRSTETVPTDTDLEVS